MQTEVVEISNLPTAKEFLDINYEYVKNHFLNFDKTGTETYQEYSNRKPLKALNEVLVEFAKLHVQAALQAAFHKIKSDALETCGSDIPDCWDDLSILNAYPLENIK